MFYVMNIDTQFYKLALKIGTEIEVELHLSPDECRVDCLNTRVLP